jgi:hypothetical protein
MSMLLRREKNLFFVKPVDKTAAAVQSGRFAVQ